MLFNSFAYGVFLPIVFILYWALPHKFRWPFLLVASYYFYMSWNPKYVFLILGTTFVSYLAAILIEKNQDKLYRKIVIIVTLIICLGILFFFKYYNFVSNSVTHLFSMFAIKLSPVNLNVLLPVGISFYTFQTLSYVIDVYRGKITAEHNFGVYATFISFFPQLVAGPIERSSNLLPHIREEKHFDYEQASYGIKLLTWGFFKKLVIADVLSPYVQMVYVDPHSYRGFSLFIVTIFFAIELYCDFSGYSDIAIGTAKMLGINLMTNFRSPYFSKSIKEFWGRWHISLSTWFKDYVYIPLGGNRVNKLKYYRNIMITFLTSGLWHGASWNYVIWGGIHGFIQILEDVFSLNKGSQPKKYGCFKMLITFLICAFAFVFFVANSLSDAVYVLTHMHLGISSPMSYLSMGFTDLLISKLTLAKISISITLLIVFDYFSMKMDVIEYISNKKTIVKHLVYWMLVIIILVFCANNDAEFVYFQF